MKITNVEAIPLRVDLPKPFHGGTYTIAARCSTVVVMETDSGLRATIWGGDEKKWGLRLVEFINNDLREVVVGTDPCLIEKTWEQMYSLLKRVQDVNPEEVKERHLRLEAIALVDMAIWDLIGQAANLPLYKVLGAYTDRLPVIAIGGYYQPGKTLEDLVDELKEYRAMGIGGVKMKVGSVEPEEDFERFQAARTALEDDFIIACDGNMGWTLNQAIRFVQLVEKSGLKMAWLEEPVEWRHQYEGLARLRQLTTIPLNAGQSEVSATECKRLIVEGCADIINIDVTVCGGITEWRRVAAMTQLWPGMQLGHHEEPLVAMHLLASVPNGYCVECFPDPARDPIWADLPLERPKIQDGVLYIPDTPGLGMKIDWDYVEKWRVDRGVPNV